MRHKHDTYMFIISRTWRQRKQPGQKCDSQPYEAFPAQQSVTASSEVSHKMIQFLCTVAPVYKKHPPVPWTQPAICAFTRHTHMHTTSSTGLTARSFPGLVTSPHSKASWDAIVPMFRLVFDLVNEVPPDPHNSEPEQNDCWGKKQHAANISNFGQSRNGGHCVSPAGWGEGIIHAERTIRCASVKYPHPSLLWWCRTEWDDDIILIAW